MHALKMYNLVVRRYSIKFRIFIYSRLVSLVDHWLFSVCSMSFLVGSFSWRLFGAFLSFIYARRNVYSDLYLFHCLGFIKDIFSITRWSRLGDFFESLRILGPSKVIRFISRPARKLAQLESAWYWKSNPAMWLPDKMWNDIVDNFDRRYLSRVKRVFKILKREVESFADYPYLRMRIYFLFLISWASKIRFPRIRRPRAFGQFLSDIRLRFSAIIASRSMLLYHGLGKNAILYGKVPSFIVSPITFDLSKKKVVLKQELSVAAVSLNVDEIIDKEILSKLLDYSADPTLFSKPTSPVSKITVQQNRYKSVMELIKKR